MTFVETLKNNLSNWQPEPGRQSLTVQEDHETGWKLELTTTKKESLGCEVVDFALHGKSNDPISLTDWATKIANREPGGLMEALRVLEIDSEQDVAILRSDEPAREEDKVAYYEMCLSSHLSATLRRYRASRTESCKREQVPFTLTNEALYKLVEDLIA
jgi:hypothetical protein